MKRALFIGLTAAVVFGLATNSPSHAGSKKLSADEIKALITDKTVSVVRKKDGKKWKMFFGSDGKAWQGANAPKGEWSLKGNKQCSHWVNGPARCAEIHDLGGGEYGRKLGKKLFVTWTAFAEGKSF